MLKELAKSHAWLDFTGYTPEKIDKGRLANEERILRFFAFNDAYNIYNGKLAAFLNDYMGKLVNMSEENASTKEVLFLSTLNIANLIEDKTALKKNVTDAILVGIAKNKIVLETKTADEINRLYNLVLSQAEFSTEELQDGVGATDKVKARIEKSIEIFGRD